MKFTNFVASAILLGANIGIAMPVADHKVAADADVNPLADYLHELTKLVAKYREPPRNTGWDSLPGQKREADADADAAKYRKPARNTGWDSLPGQKRETEAEPAKYRKPARNTGWDSLPGQ